MSWKLMIMDASKVIKNELLTSLWQDYKKPYWKVRIFQHCGIYQGAGCQHFTTTETLISFWVLKKLLNITMFSAFAFSILDPPPSPINISPVKRDRSFQQANWSGICKRLTVSTSTPQKDWFLFEFWRNFKI